MSCKIEHVILDNGEQSQLFNELRAEMPPETALKVYLSLKANEQGNKRLYGENSQGEVDSSVMTFPAFKLTEFDTREDQDDTISYMTKMFITALRQRTDVTNPFSITGIDTSQLSKDPKLLQDVIGDVNRGLKAQLTSGRLSEKGIKLVSKGLKNINRYLMDDKYLGILGRSLKSHGIPLKVDSKRLVVEQLNDTREEITDEVDLNKTEIEFNRIYDLDTHEVPVSSTILDSVRLYIKNKSAVAKGFKYTPGTPIQYEVSPIGHHRPSNYVNIISTLFTQLAGIRSVDDMISRMQNIVKTNPNIAPILEDLIAEQEQEPKEIAIVSNGVTRHIKYKPISAALFTSFAKSNSNMFTVLEATDGTTVVVPSNKSSINKRLKSRWSENINANESTFKSNEVTAPKGKSRRDKALKQAARLHSRLNYNKITRRDARSIAKLLTSTGIDMTAEDVLSIPDYIKQNPKKFRDKNGKYLPASSVLKLIVNTTIPNILKGQDVFNESVDGDFGEHRILNMLSDIRSTTDTDVAVGGFLSERGSIVHPINQSSEGQVFWERIQKDSEFQDMFLDDPLYTHSPIIKALLSEEHSGMFEMALMDVLHSAKGNKRGVLYGKLSTMDASTVKMNMFFNSKLDSKYFQALSPTLGDRGKTYAITVPKLGLNEKGAYQEIFDSESNIVNDEIRDWVEFRIGAEVDRIIRSSNPPKGTVKYKNYHGKNATKFLLFPQLNEMVQTPITSRNKKAVIREAMQHSGKILQEIVTKDVAFLVDNHVVEADTKSLAQGFKPTKISRKNFGKNNKSFSKNAVDNFLVNNFIYTYDQTLFYMGDPAYYKDKSINDMKVDINKRFALPFTPGTRLTVGQEFGISETSTVKIIEDVQVDSEMAEVYDEILDTKDVYTRMEIADGAGFVSLDRYRQLLLAQGLTEKQALEAIDKFSTWQPGDGVIDTDGQLETLKTFYYRLHKGENGVVAPFNLKYSIMPVIPSLFEQKVNGEYKYPGMAKISVELRTGKADEVVLPSAVKTGIHNVTSIDNLADAPGITIYNESVVIPQPSVSKDKYEDNFGSQMRKLVTNNYKNSGIITIDNTDVPAGVARANYELALKNIVRSGGNEAYSQFLDGESVRTSTIVRHLLSDIDNNNFANVVYFQEALHMMDDGKTVLPLNYPTVKFKVDNYINATFRKKGTRQALAGHSAVQVSSMGMTSTKSDINVASDLKFIRFQDKDGNLLSMEQSKELMKRLKKGEDVTDQFSVVPAEVRVTPKFFVNNLRKIASNRVDHRDINKKLKVYETSLRGAKKVVDENLITASVKSMRSKLVANAIETKFKELKHLITDSKGNYKLDEIRKAGLDEVVLYRIPTGNKNFMLPAKIIDFLPKGMGGTIQVPGEIVKQSGSDFDIDKVYIETADFTVTKSDKFKKVSAVDNQGVIDVSTVQKAKSYIYDFHRGVLKSTNYAQELLKPESKHLLVEIANEYGFSDDSMSSNLGSLEMQETFRANNKAGKDMIAISSVSSVAHSVADLIGVTINKDNQITISGKTGVLGQSSVIVEAPGGKSKIVRISDEIEQVQNAAMDNAKDPLLGKLNINDFTSSVVLGLVSMGFGLDYAIATVNSPIVRDVSAAYPMFTRRFSNKRSLEESIKLARKKNGLPPARKTKPRLSADLNLSRLTTARTNPTPSNQLEALQHFLAIKELGDDISAFQTAMNKDSKGTPASLAALLKSYQEYANIPGTMAHARETGTSAISMLKDNPNITFNDTDVDVSYMPTVKDRDHRLKVYQAILKYNTDPSKAILKHAELNNIDHRTFITGIDVLIASLSDRDSRVSSLTHLKDEVNKAFGTDYSSDIVVDYFVEPAQLTQQEAISSMSENSRLVRRPSDDYYEVIGTGQKLQRVSTAVLGEIEVTSSNKQALETANIVGTAVDNSIRTFFERGEFIKPKQMTEQAAESFESLLNQLDGFFERTGQKPITNPKDLLVFDEKLNMAGEMDIATVDQSGKLRIYDIKTMAKTHPSEYRDSNQGKLFLEDKISKHHRQVNAYRTLLRNRTNIEAVELFIIPLKLEYNQTGTEISSIKGVADYSGRADSVAQTESDSLIITPMKIDDGVVPDTRLWEQVSQEKILEATGRIVEEGPIGVDPIKYREHSLSQYEESTIMKPMEVNRKISTTASVHYQHMLSEASKLFGFMSENQLTRLTAEYETFMAHNTKSYQDGTTNLAKELNAGLQLELVDMSNPSSTANLLQAYRQKVRSNPDIKENLATEVLTIVTKGKRQFVTFNNTVTKGIDGAFKEAMMYAFEDLMHNEPELAESLTKYAHAFYGFQKGKNSFMELIPPSAHVTYLSDGDGLAMPEFFRAIENDLNHNPSKFADPKNNDFLLMFAANNPTKINATTLDGGMTLMEFEHSFPPRETPPKFVIQYTSNGAQLYVYEKSGYDQLQRRGIEGLVVEYHSRPESLFAEDVTSIGLSKQMNTTKEGMIDEQNKLPTNKIKELSAGALIDNYLSKFDIENRDVTTVTKAKKLREEILKDLKSLVGTTGDIGLFFNIIGDRAGNVAIDLLKRNRITKEQFQERFKKILVRDLTQFDTEFEGLQKQLLDKIQNCD